MNEPLDQDQLAQFEARAVELAGAAGQILGGYFGPRLEADYKDKEGLDPVTAADRECQEHLAKAISEHYPDHGFLGEEDEEQGDSEAPDFVWVVDPLDGTKNFLNGLPVFACSIGLLYRGAPVVGAVYFPWPTQEGGVVMHARRGGGAFVDGEPVALDGLNEPEAGRLAALPGSFGGAFRVGGRMRGKAGELRVTGSIAYELAMVAKGVLQYCVTTAPRIWDVAAGAIIVTEAGGAVMVGHRRKRRWPSGASRMVWQPLESFVPDWQSGTTTIKKLRDWSAPLVLGSPSVAAYVAESIVGRSRLRHRLARIARRASGRRPSRGTQPR